LEKRYSSLQVFPVTRNSCRVSACGRADWPPLKTIRKLSQLSHHRRICRREPKKP